VVGTTTKPHREDEFGAIGYDTILDSTDPSLPSKVKELTGGLGADAVWDCVGGTEFLRLAVSCTRIGGAVAVLGAPITDEGFDLSISGACLATLLRPAR
jgi:putative oxidoreductase